MNKQFLPVAGIQVSIGQAGGKHPVAGSGQVETGGGMLEQTISPSAHWIGSGQTGHS